MQELKLYLDKIFTEYLDYKNFTQEKLKIVKNIKEEVAKNISATTSDDEVADAYIDKVGKIFLFQRDFQQQQTRLFFTVEAFKDYLEIPQEIIKELEGFEFMQVFAIKNGKEEVINQEALSTAKEQVKSEIKLGMEEFKKRFLQN